ncbi:MAG: hypothetical protein RBS57_07700 [Desulforhabdus sp.]|jgi:hypothetical protein|nr:hypothetical protein [Desulforhabdus sp.]
MQERSYRLAQYEIILDNNGGIWWKSHGGFADTKSGRCFIEGNILFLSRSEETQPGFLKNEWLKYLKQFPRWNKTKYYCPSYTLYVCRSGRMQAAIMQPATTAFAGYDTAARPIDDSPFDYSPCPREEREAQDRLHSSSPAPELEEKGGESEQLTAGSPAMKLSEAISLLSTSSSAGFKRMTGRLGKTLRRCKGLVALNSEKHATDE